MEGENCKFHLQGRVCVRAECNDGASRHALPQLHTIYYFSRMRAVCVAGGGGAARERATAQAYAGAQPEALSGGVELPQRLANEAVLVALIVELGNLLCDGRRLLLHRLQLVHQRLRPLLVLALRHDFGASFG